MKRRVMLFSKLLLATVILGAAAYGGYAYFSHEELDLAPLAPYAETESISKLVARVQSHPPSDEGFTFVALGDTRSNFGTATRVLEAAVAEKPAFIFANGDIVRRGRPEEYIAHHLPLVQKIAPVPFITVPGNHERGPNRDYAAFLSIYGQDHFSFDYGNCRFVGINNCGILGLTWAHLRYLEDELGKPGAAHKFVTFHVPPRDMDIFVDSEEGRGFRWNAISFRKLMTKMGVNTVFMGHVHGYATSVVDGVRYTITGGGGANLAERLPDEGRAHNFVSVRVTTEGVNQEVVRLVGDEWVRTAITE